MAIIWIDKIGKNVENQGHCSIMTVIYIGKLEENWLVR